MQVIWESLFQLQTLLNNLNSFQKVRGRIVPSEAHKKQAIWQPFLQFFLFVAEVFEKMYQELKTKNEIKCKFNINSTVLGLEERHENTVSQMYSQHSARDVESLTFSPFPFFFILSELFTKADDIIQKPV